MGCSDSNTSSTGNKSNNGQNGSAIKYEPFNSKIKTSLTDYKLTTFNQCALKAQKYFKNQMPPKNSSELFVDDIFPPNYNSIMGKDSKGNYWDKNVERRSDYLKEFAPPESTIEWKRAKDIFGENYHIILNGLSMNDINQGEIGNCYLMSSLSALATYPQLLAEIFRELKIQKNGCFEIILRIDGEWQVIIIDDYFPCSTDTGNPKLAASVESGQMQVIIHFFFVPRINLFFQKSSLLNLFPE